jgi:hypothetical protein
MIKRPNLWTYVEERTEIQTIDIENLFSETIAENSPNLGKEMYIQM